MKILITLMLVVALSSCSNTKVQSSDKNTSDSIDSNQLRIIEKLEGNWYNATYFEVLAKTKDYLKAYGEVDLSVTLSIDKKELLSDTPRIYWFDYEAGGDYFAVSYKASSNKYVIENREVKGDVVYSIETTQGNDSFYLVANDGKRDLFLRDDYESHEDFMGKYSKAMIEGDYYVKNDTAKRVSFMPNANFKGFDGKYKYYTLNIWSADFHECITLYNSRENSFKEEFFKYKIYNDSVVLNRVDEYLNPLDSTLVLYSTNLKPQ